MPSGLRMTLATACQDRWAWPEPWASAVFVLIVTMRTNLVPFHIFLVNGIEVGAIWRANAGTTSPLRAQIDNPDVPGLMLAELRTGRQDNLLLF